MIHHVDDLHKENNSFSPVSEAGQGRLGARIHAHVHVS